MLREIYLIILATFPADAVFRLTMTRLRPVRRYNG